VSKKVFCFLIPICLATAAFACWQTERPPAVLVARSLNLRVTDNGKARKGWKFDLHKADTLDRNEALRIGAYGKKSLASAMTDSLGMLSFGEVKPGSYWIVAGHSLSDSVAVQVAAPGGAAAGKRLWLDYDAEGCFEVVVENASLTVHSERE